MACRKLVPGHRREPLSHLHHAAILIAFRTTISARARASSVGAGASASRMRSRIPAASMNCLIAHASFWSASASDSAMNVANAPEVSLRSDPPPADLRLHKPFLSRGGFLAALYTRTQGIDRQHVRTRGALPAPLVILSGGHEAPGPLVVLSGGRESRRSRRISPVAEAFGKESIPWLGRTRPNRETPPSPQAFPSGGILRLRSG